MNSTAEFFQLFFGGGSWRGLLHEWRREAEPGFVEPQAIYMVHIKSGFSLCFNKLLILLNDEVNKAPVNNSSSASKSSIFQANLL